MRVLVVCRTKAQRISPFVEEQVESLRALGHDVRVFPVSQGGVTGYAQAAMQLRAAERIWRPDVVHAHFGLSGLLLFAVRQAAKVVTFHGSDLNRRGLRAISRLAAWRADKVIVVAASLRKHLRALEVELIPCGVNIEFFVPEPIETARRRLSLPLDRPIIVFGAAFSREVKDFPLAQAAIGMISDDIRPTVLELRGLTRAEVRTTLNAASVMLLTSRSEGSPQVVKEAMACDCPIVAVDVGDVAMLLHDTPGSFVVPRRAAAIAEALEVVIRGGARASSRQNVLPLSVKHIAARVEQVYKEATAQHGRA